MSPVPSGVCRRTARRCPRHRVGDPRVARWSRGDQLTGFDVDATTTQRLRHLVDIDQVCELGAHGLHFAFGSPAVSVAHRGVGMPRAAVSCSTTPATAQDHPPSNGSGSSTVSAATARRSLARRLFTSWSSVCAAAFLSPWTSAFRIWAAVSAALARPSVSTTSSRAPSPRAHVCAVEVRGSRRPCSKA